MAYEWPLDKLSLINRALALTGDNLVNTQDDGSDEWNVCSPAYENGLSYIFENHNWGFAAIVKELTAGNTAPTNNQWDTAYPIPADLTHLVWLRINQQEDNLLASVTPSPVIYDIENVGGVACIVTNSRGGPPPPSDTTITPAPTTAKYISQNFSDPTFGTPTLVIALQHFVMSGIYRGLHEDLQEANATVQMAMGILQQARTKYDQQKPKRAMWNSRITAARRIRRPWPPVGSDSWGGTGVPG